MKITFLFSYIGTDQYPFWDTDDQVFVKGQNFYGTYGLTDPTTTFATITNVPPSNVYCAIFPSRIVNGMNTPNASGTTASIYYDPHQEYIWDATQNRQRLDMPMGAVTTDNTLIFKNLCSILRLNVSNNLTNDIDFDVKRLTVQAYDAYIAGYGAVTLYENGEPTINMNTPHQASDNVLSVYDPNYQSMGTIYQSNTNNNPTSKSFDIIVPPFSASDLVLEVEMYNHADGKPLGYYEYRVNRSVTVARNKIISIDLRVDNYHPFDYAYLESGPEFNADIQRLIGNNNITTIIINYAPGSLGTYIPEADEWADNSTPSDWVELQAINSPRKIYGYISQTDQSVLLINSFARNIYANSNCSTMFQGLTNVQNIQWTENVMFSTEDVTDMSYMFAGCAHLTTTSVSTEDNSTTTLNTTNVTNMSHMFDGCSDLTGLTLLFNTHNLRGDGMVAMFKGCSNLRTLDLNSFTTEQITDMTELFYGCFAISSYLYISQFVISSNTTLTDMCTNLNSSANNPCRITCTNAVHTTLLSQDEHGNYITGIDPAKVTFTNQSTGE